MLIDDCRNSTHAYDAQSGCADDKPYGTVHYYYFHARLGPGMIDLSYMSVGNYGLFLFRTITVDQTGFSYLSAGNAEWIATPSRSEG